LQVKNGSCLLHIEVLSVLNFNEFFSQYNSEFVLEYSAIRVASCLRILSVRCSLEV
jgi:hypothetical protein